MQASAAALYGKGVFTTAAIVDGEALLWEKHWKRLSSNAEIVGIDLSEYSDALLKAELDDAIEASGIANGRARVTLFDERQSELWPLERQTKPMRLQILIGGVRPIQGPSRLTISSYRVNSRSPLAGVKSCNYLEQILSLEEAKKRGFHEAVRLNDHGHVASGCMSNVFWLRGGRLYTPALSTGCLAGTTREYILEDLECDEVEAEIDELNSADAVYLTSAGLGIVSVAEFDGRELSSADHPILGLWPPEDTKTRTPTNINS